MKNNRKIKETENQVIPQDDLLLPSPSSSSHVELMPFPELYLHFQVQVQLREEAGQREVGKTQEKLENVSIASPKASN